MKTLDDINPNQELVMTESLIRLFRAAGCHPTLCHACGTRILGGANFKLVPHTKPGGIENDEMCCGKCGPAQLDRRDKKEAKARRSGSHSSDSYNGGGYSRPSRKDCTEIHDPHTGAHR